MVGKSKINLFGIIFIIWPLFLFEVSLKWDEIFRTKFQISIINQIGKTFIKKLQSILEKLTFKKTANISQSLYFT